MSYKEKKEVARIEAINWQFESEQNLSYEEIANIGEYFYKLGKRYGLLREFRENAIPC